MTDRINAVTVALALAFSGCSDLFAIGEGSEGSASSSGAGGGETCAPHPDGAPCCDPPAFPCPNPQPTDDDPRYDMLTCDGWGFVAYGSRDRKVIGWTLWGGAPDGGIMDVICWPMEGVVAQIETAANKTCYDRSGYLVSCDGFRSQLGAELSRYYASQE